MAQKNVADINKNNKDVKSTSGLPFVKFTFHFFISKIILHQHFNRKLVKI